MVEKIRYQANEELLKKYKMYKNTFINEKKQCIISMIYNKNKVIKIQWVIIDK